MASWLQACNFVKKRLQHSCFPVKFKKFLRTLILKNICKRPLLWLSEPGRESLNENSQVFESRIIKLYAIL